MDLTVMVYPKANDPSGLEGVLSEVEAAATAGFARVWVPQLQPAHGVASWDALTVLGLAGSRTSDVELATGVVAAYTQHPLALARQALTVSATAPGRLILGIGVSHRFMVSDMLGYPYDAPAAFLREYLEVLAPALAGEPVDHHGDRITAVGQVALSGAPAPALITAALGPRMLDVAGALTDGTIVTMTGPKALETHVIPRISAAAEGVGRGAPQIIVALPVVVTDDAGAARAEILETIGQAGDMPAYRRMLDAEGVDSIADVCLIGDEHQVSSRLRRFAEVGATEFVASPHGDAETRTRTTDLLRSLSP